MDELSKILSALSGYAWPGVALFFIFYFRRLLATLFASLRKQIEVGAAFKWKDFEFRGVDIFDFKGGNILVSEQAADREIYDKRQLGYVSNKNLFLVHRVRVTSDLHQDTKLPLYELSIYLVGHKSFGRLNDIERVEYYFGPFFGSEHGEFGAKFVISNGNEGFAVRTTAYGPTLCEARLFFHDGSSATVNRYLDFEGTGYAFKAGTGELDKQRLLKRTAEQSNA